MKPYTVFGSFTAHEGKVDELINILTSGHDMNCFPGCREYRLFKDSENQDKLWIFEAWDNPEAHKESLNDEIIKTQIEKAMPLIESFGENITLVEV